MERDTLGRQIRILLTLFERVGIIIPVMPNSGRIIVAGIDFSPSSLDVLKQALHIGSLRSCPVLAVHVLDASSMDHWKARGGSRGSEEELRKQALDRMITMIKQCGQEGEVLTEVAAGNPADELARLVDQREAQLLVIAANDRSKDRLGTTAALCVRQVNCDVLVERHWHGGNFKKVLVCSDLTKDSRQVVARAAEVAQANGAELEIAHVTFPPAKDFWGACYEEDQTDKDSNYVQRARAEVKERFDKFICSQADDLEKISYKTEIIESPYPAIALTCHIASAGTQLVVLGTRKKSKLASLFGGTNAERLMHDLPVSVLAVRI